MCKKQHESRSQDGRAGRTTTSENCGREGSDRSQHQHSATGFRYLPRVPKGAYQKVFVLRLRLEVRRLGRKLNRQEMCRLSAAVRYQVLSILACGNVLWKRRRLRISVFKKASKPSNVVDLGPQGVYDNFARANKTGRIPVSIDGASDHAVAMFGTKVVSKDSSMINLQNASAIHTIKQEVAKAGVSDFVVPTMIDSRELDVSAVMLSRLAGVAPSSLLADGRSDSDIQLSAYRQGQEKKYGKNESLTGVCSICLKIGKCDADGELYCGTDDDPHYNVFHEEEGPRSFIRKQSLLAYLRDMELRTCTDPARFRYLMTGKYS